MKITKNELRKIIKEEIKRLTESSSGLMVYPSSPTDNKKIEKFVKDSDYYAEFIPEYTISKEEAHKLAGFLELKVKETRE